LHAPVEASWCTCHSTTPSFAKATIRSPTYCLVAVLNKAGRTYSGTTAGMSTLSFLSDVCVSDITPEPFDRSCDRDVEMTTRRDRGINSPARTLRFFSVRQCACRHRSHGACVDTCVTGLATERLLNVSAAEPV
jgi:hypothetical protein